MTGQGIERRHREPGKGREDIISEKRQMEVLLRAEHEIAVALNTTSVLLEAMQRIGEVAVRFSQVDSGAIYLVDPKTGSLDIAWHAGLPTEFVQAIGHLGPDDPRLRLVMRGVPVYGTLAGIDAGLKALELDPALRAVGIIPIWHREQVIACLDAGSHTSDEIPVESRRLLEAIGARVGGSIAEARAREALRRSEERYRALFDSMTEGLAVHEIVCDADGAPVDTRFLEVNAAFERLTGLERSAIIGRLHGEVLPEGRTAWDRICAGVALTGEPVRFETYSATLDRHLDVVASRPTPGHIATLFTDVTARKVAEADRERLLSEARRQNAILQGINRIFREALDCYTEDEVGRICLGVAAEVTESKISFIGEGEIDDQGRLKDLAIRASGWEGHEIDTPAGQPSGPAEDPVHGLCGQVLRDGKSFYTNDLASDPAGPRGAPAGPPRLGAFLGAPLKQGGKTIGLVAVANREGGYGDEDQRALEALALAIAQVVTRVRGERALRESEEQLRIAKEAADLGIHDHDIVSENIHWDSRIREIWGLGPDERITYGLFLEGLHPDDRAPTQAAVDRAFNPAGKGEYYAEYRVRNRADGLERWVAATGHVSFARGHPVRMVGTLQEITERKRVEAALREADDRKGEFLAVLSHELRNPLAPIKNSLFILEHAAPGSSQARRAQSVINRQVDQLTHLVDDLLDVTRITRNKIQLRRQRLDLNDLVRRTLEDYRSLFETSEVKLEHHFAPSPVFADGDWNRLAQVVGNLLQNAAKFTGRGGIVRIRVSSDRVAQRANIDIADTGVGMAPEMLARLFEPFTQADTSLDRSKGGLGLGLALVKGIVELHGGDITARSGGLDQGAEFSVSLPLLPDELAAAPGPSTERRGGHRRVLIIEDNIDAADSLREALELEQHEVAVAHDGLGGIAKAREFHPEVVLCDIGLPGMDGFAVAHAFQSDQGLKDVYLVALSGYALPEDLSRAAKAGFKLHIAKPASMANLQELLAGLP